MVDEDPGGPGRELVKCVLVGDNAAGKTRLICARACNRRASLPQLLNTHVPTVWAIDQYRFYKDVLRNSMLSVDGVDVSLRLWDTFGDHHKDRRFALGRSDVVLLCFDVGRRSSLENCRGMWLPQVRRFCGPHTPVLLVGCKNDVRFLLHDRRYLSYCRERSPLVRQVREADLVPPGAGRQVARELGLPYYETSVLTYFGVNEVFENAIRAALCARRQQRFWIYGHLKRVSGPLLQAPFCPPRPSLPEVDCEDCPESSFRADWEDLLESQRFADLVLVCGKTCFTAHRFVMAAASPVFKRLLTAKSKGDKVFKSNSEASLAHPCKEPPAGREDSAAHYHGRRRRSNSFHQSSPSPRRRPGEEQEPERKRKRSLASVLAVRTKADGGDGQVVATVTLDEAVVTPRALAAAVEYAYLGRVRVAVDDAGFAREIKQTATCFEMSLLESYVCDAVGEGANPDGPCKEDEKKPLHLWHLGCGEGDFADVVFCLDDGSLSAHRALLMARCDVFRAMFEHGSYFVESCAKTVAFPGVGVHAFGELLRYLYLDASPRLSSSGEVLDVLALADRLCLPRLVWLAEVAAVEDLAARCGKEERDDDDDLGADDADDSVAEAALRLLQPSQMHGAAQLSGWCLAYLAQNYERVCRRLAKPLRGLHPENQAWLNLNRWPPLWYLKDYEHYQRLLADREREERLKNLKRARNGSASSSSSSSGAASLLADGRGQAASSAAAAAGCLCFSTKSRKSGAKAGSPL